MRDVAERGYLSYGHLSEVERGIKEASSMVLDGIATGMSMQTHDLILKTAYLMADIQVPETPEELFFIEAVRQSQSQT